MQSLKSQFYSFLITVLIGLMVGVLFDFYRIMKGAVRPGKIFTCLGDILFWLVSTLVVFLMLLIGNWGEIRFYVLIGVLFGAYIYIKFVSRSVINLLNYCIFLIKKLIHYIKITLAFLWMVITYPFIIIKNIIIVPIGFLGKIFRRFPFIFKK